MSSKYRVSQSKVNTYRRCRRAYHYRYVEELRRKRKSRPLQFGTMVHKALEFHFNGDDALTYFDLLREDEEAISLFRREHAEYGDILTDTEDIITDYLGYWDYDDIRPIRKAGRGAEHSFEIELMPDIIWNGKMDAIGKTPNRLRWLIEHKTYSRRPSDDDRWRNLQSVTYFRANDILGWPPFDGCMWDYIKSKPPAAPGILKDGTLSSKKIDTLPSTVQRVIDNHEGELGRVEALMSMAEKNRSQYFQRIYTPVNKQVVDRVFDDFEKTIIEMAENHGKHASMTIDRHCSWCDYEPLCRAKMQGLDYDYIKEREYTHGSNKEEEDNPIHEAAYEKVLEYQGN